MKKNLIICAVAMLLAFSTTIKAQEPEFEYYHNNGIRTLFDRGDGGGIYGAFTAGYTEIDGKQAVLAGGRFGWMASHSLAIGIGGTGFMNEFHYDRFYPGEVSVAGGYGGLYIEPILFPKFPVNLSFPVLFGAGGVSYLSRDRYTNENFIENSAAFLIIEPAAEVQLNITRFCRLAFGASYRYPAAFFSHENQSYKPDIASLKNVSYTVSIKFGRF
jgi:hypothetical protein